MYTLGHAGVALLVYSPVGAVLSALGEPRLGAIGFGVAALCSMVPDIDESLPIDHRGPTHTVWFAGAVTAVVYAVTFVMVRGGNRPAVVAAFVAGTALLSVLSHLVGDSITPMGITPFAPLSGFHHSFDIVPSKDSRANRLLFSAGVAVAVIGQLPVVL